jgi:hypothetical protein
MFAVAVWKLANQILLARALLFFGYTEGGRRSSMARKEGGRDGLLRLVYKSKAQFISDPLATCMGRHRKTPGAIKSKCRRSRTSGPVSARLFLFRGL